MPARGAVLGWQRWELRVAREAAAVERAEQKRGEAERACEELRAQARHALALRRAEGA
jgi:hypothetical protein